MPRYSAEIPQDEANGGELIDMQLLRMNQQGAMGESQSCVAWPTVYFSFQFILTISAGFDLPDCLRVRMIIAVMSTKRAILCFEVDNLLKLRSD
ncbi:unnamed protein product [Linum trigynum]|uniref:Uncharacterized protein n=1 Tax=Linum trigynum TaxID=586398 RepID=A0AAV2END6_9ROSI